MPDDPDRSDRLRAIAEERARVDAMIAQTLKILEERNAQLTEEEKRLRAGGDERLQFISGDGTNVPTNMEAQIATKSRAAKISASKAGRLKTSLPWQRALQLEGITAQEWAARQKTPPLGGEKARSWMKKPGRGGHAIPRFWAERIAKEYPDVPAVDASWPSGIRD